jgi:hypothetical protein
MTVVGAYAVSHAPGLLAWPGKADAETRQSVFEDGFAEAGRRLRALEPDAVVVVTGEHFANFFSIVPAFCLHVGDKSAGPIEPWLGVEKREVVTHAGLGDALLRGALADGVAMAFSRELVLDHGTMVPLELMQVPIDVPVVPLIVNTLVDPLPSLASCRDLGLALGRVLNDSGLRVVLIGAGGLSHWPGMAEAGRVSPEWDNALLDGLREGRRDVLWDPPTAGLADAGPGAEEIRAWAVAGAAAPPGCAEVLAYAAVDAWATGIAVVDLMPAAPGSTEQA